MFPGIWAPAKPPEICILENFKMETVSALPLQPKSFVWQNIDKEIMKQYLIFPSTLGIAAFYLLKTHSSQCWQTKTENDSGGSSEWAYAHVLRQREKKFMIDFWFTKAKALKGKGQESYKQAPNPGENWWVIRASLLCL